MTYVGKAVLIVVGVLLIPVLYASAAFGSNLVTNGDLEVASSNASIPQGWATDKWGTNTVTFSYPVAGNGSTKAAKVQVTKYSSGDAKWSFNHIAVESGKVYQYSDTYASTKASKVTVEYKLKNGTFSYVWLGTTASTNGTWKTFTKQFTVPANAVSMTVFHSLGAVGTLIIDNVSVQKEGAGDPPPFIDTCPNVPGDQTTTPCADQTCTQQGGTWNGSSCTMPPPSASKPIITSFAANPTVIDAGSNSVLEWSVTGASSTSLNQGIGTVTGTSKTVSPGETTVYVLTAINPAGTVTATTTVTVNQVLPPPSNNNLIQNGNLETGSGSIPTGWHSDYWGTLKATFTYPVTGKNGGKAAKLVVTNWRSGDAKWWFDHVTVSSNTMYQFTDDYNATVPSNVTIEFKMSDGSYRYEWLANAPATDGSWQTLTAQVTVPRGAVSLSILHSLDKNGTLTIDNASLVALPSNSFAQGMVTLVFDDGLISQYQNARPILTAAGVKAMYAIITGAVGSSPYMSWSDITTLKNEGHEIGGHSRTHPDLTTLTSTQMQDEVKGSFDDLVAKGFMPKTFVYPVGGVNPTVEQVTKNAGYVGARGSYWGLNSLTANKYALYDIRLDQTTTLATAKAWIDQAIADKRWLVFELHDVLPSGGDDYAISNSLFQNIVTYIKDSGIKVVTLQEGLSLMAP